LELWAVINGRKFNKCQILHQGQRNAGHKRSLRGVAGELPCRKGSGVVGRQQAQQEPAVCSGSPEGKLHPGMHQTQCDQPVERGQNECV